MFVGLNNTFHFNCFKYVLCGLSIEIDSCKIASQHWSFFPSLQAFFTVLVFLISFLLTMLSPVPSLEHQHSLTFFILLFLSDTFSRFPNSSFSSAFVYSAFVYSASFLFQNIFFLKQVTTLSFCPFCQCMSYRRLLSIKCFVYSELMKEKDGCLLQAKQDRALVILLHLED